MIKLIAYINSLRIKEAFDEHYFNVHGPITEKIPGFKEMKVTKIAGSPMGGEDEIYTLMCEMYYDESWMPFNTGCAQQKERLLEKT